MLLCTRSRQLCNYVENTFIRTCASTHMIAHSIFSCGHVCKYSKLPFLSDFAAVFMKNSAVNYEKYLCTNVLQVPFAKEPYKKDRILQKRPIVLRSLYEK